MNTGFSPAFAGIWVFINYLLPILFGLAALTLSASRPGKNAASIRAVAVVSIFAPQFWLGAAALGWAALDAFFPNISIKIPMPEIKRDATDAAASGGAAKGAKKNGND